MAVATMTLPNAALATRSPSLGHDLRDEDQEKGASTNPSVHESLQEDNDEKPAPSPPPAVASEPTIDASEQPEPDFINGARLVAVLASVTLATLLMLLDTSIIVTAIPRITDQFHSLKDVGWYGSAYLLANAALIPLTGKFYQYFSSKWTYLVFFAVFELGSLLCGLASSSKMLILGRAVAGLGGSGLMSGALTIIAGSVPMVRRPALTGLMIGVANLGLVIGPVVGGAFTEYTTWRWCFYINLPIGGVVAALIVFVHVPEQIPKGPALTVARTVWRKLDLIGFVLFAPASIMFLLALEYGGNDFAWDSATVIGLFCGAGVTFFVFLMWEYRVGDTAMIPFSIATVRTVWSSSLVMLMQMSLTFVASYYLPIYFQAIKGKSPLTSGVDVLPSILSQLFFAVLSGALVGRLGYYLPWILFGSAMAAIGNGLISTFSPTTTVGKWIGYQIILGVGRGAAIQMPIIAVQNTVAPAMIAPAMSLIIFGQTFGGAIFLTFANTIFTNCLKSEIPKYAPSVNPQVVINAGATAVRKVVSQSDLPGVLLAYSKAVDYVFYLAAAAGVAAFAFAWGMGWKDIREKKNIEMA